MIKIGIITAKGTIENFKPIFEAFHDQCEYYFLTYEKLQEIHKIFHQNKEMFDGFIFGGPLPYYFLEEELKSYTNPVVYVDLTKEDFYKHLFKITQQHKGIDFSRVVIDYVWNKDNLRELQSLLPDNKKIYTLENTIDFKNNRLYEEILNCHVELWEKGLIDLSITRAANIVDLMKAKGLNVYYMGISEDTIKGKIEELITHIEFLDLKENQVVAGFIDSPVANSTSENELIQISIYKELLEFSFQNDLQLVIQRNNNSFEISTSYRELQEITNDYRSCKLIRFLKERLSFDVYVGWGIGRTFTQAAQHAKLAYSEAKSYIDSCTFVIDEAHHSMGPLGFKETDGTEITFHSWNEIEQLSQQVDITVSQLQKVITAITRLKTNELTSNTAADVLNMSARSTNRLLNELVEKGLANVESRKINGLQGRPTKVYTINLPFFNPQ
ncbi:MarR family transcriptional regulator [Sporosarcina sp. FA9]|uniref:MarR family transcriptional regulator n=1 Tax=Sporosarcina sp. FA9 TaxID=3413030 RepID=UPI003F65D458